MAIRAALVATIGEAAKRFSVSPQTVRGWCEAFKEFLSPSATPPMGEVRLLTPEDMAALGLVARMRLEFATTEAIKTALASGERVEIEEEEPEFYPPAPRLMAELAKREGQLEELKEERDHLREALTQERQAHLEALERAARAEASLDTYKALQGPTAPSQSATEAPARKWWQVWK